MKNNYFLLLSLLAIVIIYAQDEQQSTEKSIVSCRERKRLISSNKNEEYDLTAVIINETLNLECHYCNENDENEPKVWYKTETSSSTPKEVKMDMNKDDSLNRISVTTEHTLTIKHVTLEDAGIYYCHGVQGQESENKYNYLVDLISDDSRPPEKGNMSTWRVYNDEYMAPVKRQLLNSNETEYSLLRYKLKTNLEIVTEWEPNWRPCEVCGRPQGEGIQVKYGFCRIKIENNYPAKKINLSSVHSPEKFKYFLKLSQLSCKSLLFEDIFPSISNVTKMLLDFIWERKCDGVCNPDAAGVNRGWKFGKSKGYKYRRTITMNEGEHLTLVCPESNLDNTIIWRRNGKKLKQGEDISTADNKEEIPRITVDAFNSLYLMHVTSEETGNYTCQVDDIRMQQIRVFVVSKSRLLSRAFLRHMLYLVFILTLSCSCYCAGVVAACKRKHKFKGYKEVATATV